MPTTLPASTRLGVSALKLSLASARPVLTATGDVLFVPVRTGRGGRRS